MKFLTLVVLVILSCVIAGIYGILHDQLTYTISPEYYTKFKFYQFGLVDNEVMPSSPRFYVSIVGLFATWWMGIPIGIILGVVGLFHKNWTTMFTMTLKAFVVTIVIAFATGLTGLAYGYFYLADNPRSEFVRWYIPDNLVDFKSFITVGSMHNFSYMGGLIGLIGGVFYLIPQKQNSILSKKQKVQTPHA